jgi:CRP-like cAMP-binding protein
MPRSLSARDDTSQEKPPAGEAKEAFVQDEADDNAAGPTRPFSRLVTTSAVAAALAEVQGADAQVGVERPKRRRLDRRHSGMEPLAEAGKQSPSSTIAALQLPQGHRMSAPVVEPPAGEPTQVVIKPMRLGSASPRGHLKRATSTHLAGIRERLKAAGQAGAPATTIKRTPSSFATPALKRTPSASTTPTFRAVAKAVAVSTALASGGAAAATSTDKAEQGQHYEQMMARFQLRRLEPTDQTSGRSVGNEAKVLNRWSSTYLPPVDSDMSQRRADELMSLTRPRSEGELVETTVGRGGDRDVLSSQSRADESPRRPGAPSFHSLTASVAPKSPATVTPVGHLGTIGGGLGGSVRSIASVVKNAPSAAPDQEQALSPPQGGSIEKGPGQQQSGTRRDSGGVPALDQKLMSRVGSRPRPLPRLKKRLRVFLVRLRTPMSPFSRTARLRSLALLVAFCVHTLGFPYEAAFHSGGRSWFISADVATEMAFMTDFLLAFNTSFVNKRGVLVVSRRHIAWNFLTGACIFQLIAALPVMTGSLVLRGSAGQVQAMEAGADAFNRFSHTLVDIVIRSHRIVHVLRLLREVGQVRDARIDKSVLGWLLYSRYSHLLRIVWIVGAVMLIAHCVACCWRLLLIDSAEVDPSTIVARTCGAHVDPTVELVVYAECFYVAMQMLQGQSLTTHSARENVFASCVNLLGSIVLAVIFGHVAMLVANFNANSTAYQRKMESVFAGMTKMQLPASLRERIHQYYAHLWREYEALDGAPLERFAKELSHNLTLEVVLFKYMELAMHVPFWEHCSPDFQKTLVLSLDTRVYLPDDFIVRRGEVGDEFYMINRGMCELVGSNDTQEHATEPLARRRSQLHDHSDHPADTSTLYTTSHDGTVYPERDDLGRDAHRHGRSGRYSYVTPDGASANPSVKTLTRGQAFGEMALLMNYQRTANVRAMTYVEMCVLSRTAFQAVLTRYPADRKHVISQILISSLENNERFGIPCPLTAMVRSVFAGEIDGVASGEKFITPRRAAKLIAWAVNPDVEDDSIKFALSSKLQDQLLVVRDQEFGVPTLAGEDTPRQAGAEAIAASSPRTSRVDSPGGVSRKRSRSDADGLECSCTCNGSGHAAPSASPSPAKPEPAVESLVLKLESVQGQALALIQELQRGVQNTLYPPPPVDTSVLADVAVVATDAPPPRRASITRGGSSKTVTIQQRRSKFVSARSTSAPNFTDLDATVGRSSDVNEAVAEPSAKAKPASTPPKPLQRAVTARWMKTSESSRPLRGPNTFAPLVRPRAAGSSSHRFIQRVTNQLASLATSSSSTAQASPTRYADQLFGTTQPNLDAVPSVNEMSYREDSNVSGARY